MENHMLLKLLLGSNTYHSFMSLSKLRGQRYTEQKRNGKHHEGKNTTAVNNPAQCA
jgi:hypothetical protein